MRSRAAVFLVFVFVSLLAASASAQNTPGRLTGLVTDAQGAILPGVTVTATSPSLIGGQTTVTQADGKFLFPALPTGQYKLVFELSGFQKLTRENINVAAGPDDFGRRAVAARVADRERDGDRRVARDRRDDDQGRHQSQGRRADRRAELHRPVGRAVGGAGHPYVGLRRRRQPQEPAVRLRKLRRAEPGARRSRTASITRKASAAPASTRTISPTKKCR